MTEINWKHYHRFQQKPGWCGPAIVQMVFLVCGIKKTQASIAKEIYKDWWGTNQQIMLAYLSRFFKIVNYKHNALFSDLSKHLKKGHIVLINWMDDMVENSEPEGHYCIVGDYDSKTKMLTLVDPSNERQGIWQISAKEFNHKWYDTLDINNKIWINGWMLWIDPKTKLVQVPDDVKTK